jgi:drug/metabolite transporter (DMT)-like permease
MQIQNTEKSRVHARSPLPAMKGTSSMLMTIVPILLSTVLGVAGQFLLKQGMTQMGTLQLSFAAVPSILWRMSTSPYVIGGLMVYVSGTFFWLIVLNRVQLSYAYPFASLSYVLIALTSWILLQEDIRPLRWLGMLVICAGVFLVSRS